jgi:L-asparagine transporter-like permease
VAGRGTHDRAGKGKRLAGRILTWALIILIVIWVISNPTAAGSQVHSWITDISNFFTHLARG